MKTNTELKSIIKQALKTTDKNEKYRIILNIHNDIGKWDNANRYILLPEYLTLSSVLVRKPSRHFPKSVYNHIFTNKYLKQLMLKLV